MAENALPRIALASGDPAGIGPELIMKAATDPEVRTLCRPILVADMAVLTDQAARSGIDVRFAPVDAAEQATWDGSDVPVLARRQFEEAAYEIGQVSAASGHASLDSCRAAIQAALAGHVEAVIAAPQTQTSIKMAGIDFDGYPTFVARETGLDPADVFLMLCYDDFRLVHTTLHVSVRDALDLITPERVRRVIQVTDGALKRLGIAAPRILVGGLNPHAGEGGLFGPEDGEIVSPAIEEMRSEGIDVRGPVGADLMMHDTDVDAHIVMLHDQGHIPAKLMAKHRTAGLSIGSPILFSSVAHGSAHDIAGQGKAQPTAVVEAIRRLSAAGSV